MLSLDVAEVMMVGDGLNDLDALEVVGHSVAIETMTGKTMPKKYKDNFADGIEEIDLVRSGLDDMMIDGFQSVKKVFLENKKIPDFRTAAFITAIEKIALSYDFIGL